MNVFLNYETLQDETGIDIQYQASGLIKIANQIDDVAHLRSQFHFTCTR